MANEPFIFTVCPVTFSFNISAPFRSDVWLPARRKRGREAQEEKTSRRMVGPRTRILQVGVVSCVRARCLRGQVRKRGHSRISRRDPPIPLSYIYIYINRDNRASVTGQWPGLRPRISFVGSRRRDAHDTPSITMRAPRKIARSARWDTRS